MDLETVALAPQTHLREWTKEEVANMSDDAIEIVLEEMKDEKRPTADEDHVYLAATKILRAELRMRKKRAAVDHVREKEEDAGADQGKGTSPRPHLCLTLTAPPTHASHLAHHPFSKR